MRFLKLSLLSILFLAFQNSANAQTTGSFDTTITFMGQPRTFSLFVPNDYDPNHNYRLVVGLHGLGDNSTNYRNALINSLGWSNLFDSTIFIFPDGGDDQNSDFHMPAGDELVIPESVLLASQVYSIDNDEIILQGLSLGGRSALKYGLDNPADFKALLLNVPALQGLLDLNNEPGGASLIYNYVNASQIPIYITLGATDFIYTATNIQLASRLKKNNGVVHFNLVAGLGHSIPNNTQQGDCIEFFEHPETMDFDVDLFEIEMEERTCNSNISPKVHIQNKGLQNLTSLEINYSSGGANSSFTWTGNLGLYESTIVNIPAISGTRKLNFNAAVGSVNANQMDPVTSNNQQDKDFEIVTSGTSLQVFEGFEGNADDWLIGQTGSLFPWEVDNSVSRDGQNSIYAFNTILIFNTFQARESFSSPIMDLSSVQKPTLAFDVAFNYHQYTPPYFTDTVNFADTLEVLVSTDCGATFQSVFKKGGADLATIDNPILNPLSVQECFFNPKDSTEWRKERIDLSAFANADEAIVRFDYISSLGGSINVDNIAIDDASVISEKEELKDVKFEMYPNPASDKIILEFDSKVFDVVQIIDLNGKLVYQTELGQNDNSEINIEFLQNGIYLVKLNGVENSRIEKLIVK